MKIDYSSQKFVSLRLLSVLLVTQFAMPAQAAVVNLAGSPLYTTTTSAVLPNLMFILDNSGSMGDDYLPDDVPNYTRYGYKASQCNGVAYNPAITYTVPVDSLGNDKTAPSFTAACNDGFSGTCTVDLTGSIYYKYAGSQTPLSYTYTSSGVVTSSTFYKECNSSIGNTPGSGVFTSVTVNSTSGPGATDERQNYANWYSFYRKRLLMMKTAAGQAFKKIDNKFRVGFTTISYTGASDLNAGFLTIRDFDSTQKASFYSKLYAASGSSSTPLRGALSKVGRIYAGKLGTDPMQYSCQQNFTILSTDGYWNTGSESTSYGPFGLNGTTPVGQQDGGGTLKPMWDGETNTSTVTTPTDTTYNNVRPKTTVDRKTQTITDTTSSSKSRTDTYTKTVVTLSSAGCSGQKKKATTTNYSGTTTETQTTLISSAQLQEQLTTTGLQDAWTSTERVNHIVVTTNGTVTSDTYSAPTVLSSSAVVTTTTSGPTVDPWTNVGSPTVTPTTTSSFSPPVASISWAVTSSSTGACANGLSASAGTPTLASAGAFSAPVSGTPGSSTSASTHTSGYPQTTTGTTAKTATGSVTQAATTSSVNSGGNANSLADVAMYYYQTDLRNPGNCLSGSTGANLCPTDTNGNYSPNVPGNGVDNNVKPHMTTFTLGLGLNGLLQYSPTYLTDTSGDFSLINSGAKIWPDPDTSTTFPYANTSNSVIERIDDLWHAAVNGRGQYFSAKNPTQLVTSLNTALAGMSARLGYGTSAATSNLSPIVGDNALYVASYTTAQWTGNLVADSIDINSGTVLQNSAWCVEDVQADADTGVVGCSGKLKTQVGPASDTRAIYFNKSGTLTGFNYSALTTAQKAYFDPSKLSQWATTFDASDKGYATGDSLVNYLRGQTQYESKSGSTANLYRARKNTLGDIVDTAPVYVGKPSLQFVDPGYSTWKNATAQQNRTAVVFAGANDGMLHAFNAATGVELWAYVPSMVMPQMYWLADSNYTTSHHNYVDGPIMASDVCVNACSDATNADWRTILVGGLGSGGRGYYALDVTNPASPKLLWEFNSLNQANMGYSYGKAVPMKKSNGTWVIAVSSGYDNVLLSNGDPYDVSGDGKGYVFLLDPLTGSVSGSDIISTATGDTTTPSGLGKIAYWADNPVQDSTALYAYGGDLLGNLWRFDINTKAVVKLATFTDASSNTQPITTQPELALVDGNRVVYISTGKYLESSDLNPTYFKTQSLYAIIDSGANVPNPRSVLVQQTMTDNKPNRSITDLPVTFSPPSHMGWYVDFPDSGERSNVDMILAQGTLLVPTNVPTNGNCEAGGYSWLNFFNYRSGGLVPGATTAGIWTGNDLTTGLNLVWIKGKPVVIRTGSGSAPALLPGTPFNTGGAPGVKGHRVSWREIVEQ